MDYPWGSVRPGPGNALPTGFTYTGQLDTDVGLMYYGARFYDPALARFISADTIVPEPGDPQALNRYSYVSNRPTVYVDPTGRAQVCGGSCPQDWDELTHQWYAIEDQGLLDATILTWIQDHQNIATIEAMMIYLEANYGQTGAILPLSFNTMYAHGFAAGEFGRLSGNSQAQLIAGAIFAGVGIGGANLGGLKREVAGGTYKLVDPVTENVMRTGRTKNLAQRQAQHARKPDTSSLRFDLDIKVDDYAVQRGREQMLHDQYQPPLNKIRPISPRNPQRQSYLDAARRFLDMLP